MSANVSVPLRFRNAHPHFFDEEGVISRLAFHPNSNDKGAMSVDDSDQIAPKGSFEFYRNIRNKPTVGVWGLTQEDLQTAGLDCRPDPLDDAPWHCLVDFNVLASNAWKGSSKKLRDLADVRGCLYKP